MPELVKDGYKVSCLRQHLICVDANRRVHVRHVEQRLHERHDVIVTLVLVEVTIVERRSVTAREHVDVASDGILHLADSHVVLLERFVEAAQHSSIAFFLQLVRVKLGSNVLTILRLHRAVHD